MNSVGVGLEPARGLIPFSRADEQYRPVRLRGIKPQLHTTMVEMGSPHQRASTSIRQRMGDFLPLRLYTRREISDKLGGGVQDYLPHADGRVVCACLSREYNPDAPYVILPGTGPDIVRWGDVFAQQRDFVPVFLKRATNAWQYVGRFRVQERSVDAEQIERWGVVSDRLGEISMVLYLESEERP
jgi:hypothetical protein